MATTDVLATRGPIGRRARHNGDEQDAFSKWARRRLCRLINHPEGIASTKRLANRRDRRQTRALLRTASVTD